MVVQILLEVVYLIILKELFQNNLCADINLDKIKPLKIFKWLKKIIFQIRNVKNI